MKKVKLILSSIPTQIQRFQEVVFLLSLMPSIHKLFHLDRSKFFLSKTTPKDKQIHRIGIES